MISLKVRCVVVLSLSLLAGFPPAPMTSFGQTAQPAAAENSEFFETRIRPLLAQHCWSCHGPEKQKSGLRLDVPEAVLKGGDMGPGVVPGDLQESLIIAAVEYSDDYLKMPPAGRLSDQQIADLTSWVESGAPWPSAPPAAATAGTPGQDPRKSHWAFQPVKRPEPPPVKVPSWVANPVDAFILARLEEKGLAPSPPADPAMLIRRLTFDLTGLPPTPAETQAFVSNPSPEAYQSLVDRLLASPHYGERWGRHWLDVARYADTKGYVFQEERRYPFSYTYRDWVIKALNEDMPYNQFITAQLAADRLVAQGQADPSLLAAMGFLTVGRRFLNNIHDITDDRIDVTSRGLLGLTVSCARCHDHKYDPISAQDYYALYGIFASSQEPEELPLLSGDTEQLPDTPEARDYALEKAKRLAAIDQFSKDKQAEFSATLRASAGAFLRAAAAASFNPGDPNIEKTSRDMKLRPELARLAAARWAELLKSEGPPDDLLAPLRRTRGLPPEQFNQGLEESLSLLRQASSGNPASGALLAELSRDPRITSPSELVERYAASFDKAQAESKPPELEPLRAWITQTDRLSSIDLEEVKRLVNRDERNRLQELRKAIPVLDASHPGAPPRAMVMVDREKPVDPHVFLRGNPDRRGDPVPRRFIKFLAGESPPSFDKDSGRLELAQAIADPSNPLTARVIVNRVWMLHFGAPLVSTPSDFGLRSDPPTHPDLLDWLAATFVESGWSLKSLHRLLLLSNTYQQQSLARSEAISADPENRLFWRQNRKRLELEALRDSILEVAGKLDRTPGGRPVPITEPPFPPRRSIYGFIDRQNLDNFFRSFDMASPDTTSPRRFVTTVPQQALYLMNSPFLTEQAKSLAARAQREAPDPSQKIRLLHQWLFSRQPTDNEISTALALAANPAMDQSSASGPTWQYGYGTLDENAQALREFRPLPHWTGKSWQLGPEMPHQGGNYLQLTATGGHTGPDQSQPAIRRWVAPDEAIISITGTLEHRSDKGDGVRARIVVGQGGIVGSWTAHNNKVAVEVSSLPVKKGETVDFVLDCVTEPSFDSFNWAPTIRRDQPAGAGLASSWSAKEDFSGPPPPPLSSWEALAQALLLSNEFAYID